MGALRERYFALHGVGHADRPWLDNPLSMDAQSRGVRFPIARWRRDANSNPDRNSDSNCHCGSISNADCHGNGDCYPDTVRQAISNSETSSDSTAAPVVL